MSQPFPQTFHSIPLWAVRRFLFDLLFRFTAITPYQVQSYFARLLGRSPRAVRHPVHALNKEFLRRELLMASEPCTLLDFTGQQPLNKEALTGPGPRCGEWADRRQTAPIYVATRRTYQVMHVLEPWGERPFPIMQGPDGPVIVSSDEFGRFLSEHTAFYRDYGWPWWAQFESYAQIWLNIEICATQLYIDYALPSSEISSQWWSQIQDTMMSYRRSAWLDRRPYHAVLQAPTNKSPTAIISLRALMLQPYEDCNCELKKCGLNDYLLYG